MKTIHINLEVINLEKSVEFYNTLFGQEPTVIKPDYAKWQMDDPRVNFSLSKGGDVPGIKHLGIQTDSQEELAEIYGNLKKTKSLVIEEGHTTCCYANSEKSWVKDPQGVEWEAFHSYGVSEVNKISSTCCDETCCA
jgi:catechol 2,3-dioxygenase-like lactoylglutathione lyase family enzyme